MRFEHRAERITNEQVAETFVAVGPVMDLLSSNNNQIMYGRRGTGKTHALRYFANQMNQRGDLAIYIDAQNLGSNGSIYNDPTLPTTERATRLLVDVCGFMHGELIDIFTDPNRGWNLAEAAPLLDGFVAGFSETRIAGPVERETIDKTSTGSKRGATLGGEASAASKLNIGLSSEATDSAEESHRSKRSGTESSLINFSFFSQAIRQLAAFIRPKRMWVLIDEWTTIPTEIQPYLADLLRRAMFSVPNISVKIAAIEHRATFKADRPDEGYIGFELGADISAAINLDDYLLVENDENKAKQFFGNFITSHAISAAREIGVAIDRPHTLIATAFTQDNVFTEFVRATEGVPRDAMHILSLAAQRSGSAQISMQTVRNAAYSFYQTEKYNTIQTNEENRRLLDWIRDEVIMGRRTRAFLLPVSTNDKIIDRLFDRRALHILNRSRSAAHRPGERFIVYKIDYGVYVDLISTDKYPSGLLVDSEAGGDIDFDVPSDDARSFRRAILDLDRFYAAHADLSPEKKASETQRA